MRVLRFLSGLLMLAALSCSGGSGGNPTPLSNPDFTLVAISASTLQAGTSGSVPVGITRVNGQNANVTVTVATNPQGITGSGAIASGTSSANVTVTVPAGVASGVYSLQISATDGTVQRSAPWALTVTPGPDFSFTVTSPSAIPVGQSGSAAVSVTRSAGHTAALSLGVQANAQGVTGSGTIIAGISSGALTLTVPSSAAPGTYTLTAIATDGTLVRNATFGVTLAPGNPVTLTIPVLYITQSTQTQAFDVPLVKDRDGYLRAFVVASGPNAAQPSLHCEIRNGTTTVFSQTIPAPASSVPTAVNESSLLNSWNVAVPASAIQPGCSVLATLSTGGVTWPASGTPQLLDVRTLPAFRATFWAVQTGDGRLGGGGTLASDAAKYPGDLQKIWPVTNATEAVYGGVFTTSVVTLLADGSNWGTVLGELQSKRTADPGGSGRQYYGVVNPDYAGGVAGLGYIGAPAAIGWDKASTQYPENGRYPGVYAHETGHNFGRVHAPCGVAGDPSWPTAPAYADALIGVWGLDTVTGTLHDPNLDHDLMSYCSPVWVSDYNYKQVLAHRQGGALPVVVAPAASVDPAVNRSLLLWGRMEDDAAILEPAFHLPVDAQAPQPGTQLMEGLDGAGRTLFSTSFELTELADLPQDHRAAHFSFSVPLSVAQAGQLSEIRWTRNGVVMARKLLTARARLARPSMEPRLLSGPDGRTTLAWDPDTEPVVMVRDKASGNVLGFGRGGSHTFAAAEGGLEIHLSNGVSSRSVTLEQGPGGARLP